MPLHLWSHSFLIQLWWLRKSLRVQGLNQINTWQQLQGTLPALIFFLLPLYLSLLFFQPQHPLYWCPPVVLCCWWKQLGDAWGTSGEDKPEQVWQWKLSWGCAVSAGTGQHRRCRYTQGVQGVESCVVAVPVAQHCAQGGKGTVLHRKVCSGESCFTWWRALWDAPLCGEAVEKTPLWGATDWAFVRYSWMWPQSSWMWPPPKKCSLSLTLKVLNVQYVLKSAENTRWSPFTKIKRIYIINCGNQKFLLHLNML